MLATIWTVIVARFSGFRIGRPNPTKGDVLSALTNGVASIPDGMTSGVIAGINPVYGLYTLMVYTPVAALTVSTRLMVVNTTSAMILVAADGLGDLEGDERVQAMIGITLIAGIFQLAPGSSWAWHAHQICQQRRHDGTSHGCFSADHPGPAVGFFRL